MYRHLCRDPLALQIAVQNSAMRDHRASSRSDHPVGRSTSVAATSARRRLCAGAACPASCRPALAARCSASCGPTLTPDGVARRSRLAGWCPTVDPDQVLQSVLPLDGCRTGEVNMEFPHWLMIGGALLVFVGLVGAALQRRRAAADPSESNVADEQPAVPLPKSLE